MFHGTLHWKYSPCRNISCHYASYIRYIDTFSRNSFIFSPTINRSRQPCGIPTNKWLRYFRERIFLDVNKDKISLRVLLLPLAIEWQRKQIRKKYLERVSEIWPCSDINNSWLILNIDFPMTKISWVADFESKNVLFCLIFFKAWGIQI